MVILDKESVTVQRRDTIFYRYLDSYNPLNL